MQHLAAVAVAPTGCAVVRTTRSRSSSEDPADPPRGDPQVGRAGLLDRGARGRHMRAASDAGRAGHLERRDRRDDVVGQLDLLNNYIAQGVNGQVHAATDATAMNEVSNDATKAGSRSSRSTRG